MIGNSLICLRSSSTDSVRSCSVFRVCSRISADLTALATTSVIGDAVNAATREYLEPHRLDEFELERS